jgi:hypothetical protein
MSQVSKLNMVNSKLGATMPGQQTTRVVYDSITSVANQKVFEFFTNFANKTEFQTNLSENKLNSSESMVIKSLYMLTPDNGILKDASMVSIVVGNQVVVKDLPICFNAEGGLAYDRLNFNDQPFEIEIRFVTDIVIPPQVSFKAVFTTSNNTPENINVTLGLRGYGTIFSAGSTF